MNHSIMVVYRRKKQINGRQCTIKIFSVIYQNIYKKIPYKTLACAILNLKLYSSLKFIRLV